MMHARLYSCLPFIAFMTMGFLAFSPTYAREADMEEEAGSVELERIVELERAVHFLTPSGEDVVVSPGDYTVEAADGGLRMIPSEEAEEKTVTIEAKPTSHEESLEVAEPKAIAAEDDRLVVMLLLPDGKAWQAVGSYSGVQTRGFKLKPGFLKGIKLPTVKAIFTVPKLGAVTPGGTLYIKGIQFGTKGFKSKVVLHLTYPKKHEVPLSVQEWADTKITAKIPGDISGVIDHKAKFQVMDARGLGGAARRVPFYAAREGRKLSQKDPAVRLLHCSTGADYNDCNGLNANTGGSCFASSQKIFKERGAIYARHVNCDAVIDWDEGEDRYAITLKNGWVFKKVQMYHHASSPSEKIYLPDYQKLRETLPGTKSWNPKIGWKVSPGPDQLEYAYELWIEGPKGVSHY